MRSVFYFGVELFSKQNAIGKGINYAARICGIGDEKHIIVSKDFIELFRDECSEDHKFKFNPSGKDKEEPFWEAFVKHEEIVLVSNYYYQSENKIHYGNNRKPKKIQIIQTIQNDILKLMNSFEKTLSEISQKVDSQLTENNLKLRSSILLYRKDENDLYVSSLRHYQYDKLGESKTRFKIKNSDDKPVGLPAFVFRDNKTLWILGLPDYHENTKEKKEYYKRLSEYNLTKKEIDNWNRKARAYISSPINMDIIGEKAVLSIDSELPLNVMSKANQDLINEDLENNLCPMIAALLQIKKMA
jgi:hypothetical protein